MRRPRGPPPREEVERCGREQRGPDPAAEHHHQQAQDHGRRARRRGRPLLRLLPLRRRREEHPRDGRRGRGGRGARGRGGGGGGVARVHRRRGAQQRRGRHRRRRGRTEHAVDDVVRVHPALLGLGRRRLLLAALVTGQELPPERQAPAASLVPPASRRLVVGHGRRTAEAHEELHCRNVSVDRSRFQFRSARWWVPGWYGSTDVVGSPIAAYRSERRVGSGDRPAAGRVCFGSERSSARLDI
jgi:hypothetical protein